MSLVLECLLIYMDIPYVFDCNFGSVWIFDSILPEHVWQWCGFKTSPQQITSTSNMLNIKVIHYQSSEDVGYITVYHSVSSCVGIFTRDFNPTAVSKLTDTVELDIISDSVSSDRSDISLSTMPGKCLVVQSLRENKKHFVAINIFGFRNHEVREFAIFRAGFHDIIDCEYWEITLRGLLSVANFGRGVFSYSKAIDHDPFWKSTSLRAEDVLAIFYDYYTCGHNDGLIIAVNEECNDLLLDRTSLVDVHEEMAELSQAIRLQCECQKFMLNVGNYQSFRLSIDVGLLCMPLVKGVRFPCVSRQGIICEDVRTCVLRIEASLVTSSTDCGYYVDVINYGYKLRDYVQLRWHLDYSSRMILTINLRDEIMDDSTNIDITNDRKLTSLSCNLEITQIVIRQEQQPMPQIIIKEAQLLSPACLTKRAYFNDVSRVWVPHSFKWDMSPEHIVVGDESYIRVNSSDLSWVQSEEFCQTHNGHLVSITSQEEEDVVKVLFSVYGGHTLMPSAVYIGIRLVSRFE